MILSKLAGRPLLLTAGLLVALALPWFVYPPVAMDILCWALFAAAVDRSSCCSAAASGGPPAT